MVTKKIDTILVKNQANYVHNSVLNKDVNITINEIIVFMSFSVHSYKRLFKKVQKILIIKNSSKSCESRSRNAIMTACCCRFPRPIFGPVTCLTGRRLWLSRLLSVCVGGARLYPLPTPSSRGWGRVGGCGESRDVSVSAAGGVGVSVCACMSVCVHFVHVCACIYMCVHFYLHVCHDSMFISYCVYKPLNRLIPNM